MSITRRLAAAALAAAAACTTAVVTAPPAQAMIKCGENPLNYCLLTIDWEKLLKPQPECMCELAVLVNPADHIVLNRVDGLVNQGAYDFRLAGRTTSPAERARLQQAGTAEFTQAMGLLSAAPRPGDPSPDPWVQAAGRVLVTGLQATFDAQRTRDPRAAAALRARALAAFQAFGSR